MDPRFSGAQLTHTLPLQVANQIGLRVVEEVFAPGERLKETELAESFAVSRATIREALRILESRGLVTIQPQRGAQVTQLSVKELDDFFEIRAVLLGLGSRRVAMQHTPEDLTALQTRLQQLEAHVEVLDDYARLSGELVSFLMRLSGSVALAAYIDDFGLRIGRYVRLGLSSVSRRRQSLATWRKLLKAISAHDGDLAEAIHRHLALENRQAALAEFERRMGKSPKGG
ncbi:MAG: GntR family transcriptional regulator [Gammaproteobacteria bacterium]|nr:GntR family transcriptional regulator [Gammaproteobacteria bacterium]MBU1444369.1 GntR family transcriptional regulator [Gammaproteobacteria bacterium]MBU2285906.1 GntR family transcriptional regulator [Gammaproteobacteria bacterium]MBU2409342.1 GntR family transcriptional regulator [Gammaproteobacteria bacterium]